MTIVQETRFVRAAALEKVRREGCLVTVVGGHTVALFVDGDEVRAVDNRCPHMGFPLHRGSVRDGILTCHWHHARFDLRTGGTFDQWADDLRSFPAEIREGDVWVDVAQRGDLLAHRRRRLRDGLERDLSLVIAKSVIGLAREDPRQTFTAGLLFGVSNRAGGWSQGLTILTCMSNLLPHLDPADRPRALHPGLAAVAGDSAGMAPRFPIPPLPDTTADPSLLASWFRRFVEVLDAEGAERCIASAVASRADPRRVADMLFAAATDHRYLRIGHVLDFTNKALEALDTAGWEHAGPVLGSLATGYAEAERMEESNSWRNPVDLVAILEAAFEQLPGAIAPQASTWAPAEELTETLLGEDAQAIVDALLETLRAGAGAERVAAVVTHAAALRIARFHTSNEFGDWDTALHTFTFANAVHQGLRRSPSPELVRGVFDAAMSVYLDRFLNVPPARIPDWEGEATPGDLLPLLDRQQQVDEAAALAGAVLGAGDRSDALIAAIGSALLREDRDFHTIQMVEAAVRQHGLRAGTPHAETMLIAAARYLAAHSPTARAQAQTYQIAARLGRGERLYEEID
ncbi:MAG: Rieske (2Fe-2S) protein [Gaiellales bacterium]